mmetsp:Transcript_30360/g.32723  ORF Transcript_30360/g.32723 Transcript_30360/m.32723 type:complete len:215 (+) Transcript_30360:53-697(+)
MNQLPVNHLDTRASTTATKRPRKSVKFNNSVYVAKFEKCSATERKAVWFDSTELNSIRAQGRELMLSYRKKYNRSLSTIDYSDSQFYRGFESCTLQRQRQRILSNRSVVYGHRQGMNDKEVAMVYKTCSDWSIKVAFIQAIHDYFDIYPSTTVLQPTIASMFLPTPLSLPFSILSYKVLQQQQKNKRRIVAPSNPNVTIKIGAKQARQVRQRVC